MAILVTRRSLLCLAALLLVPTVTSADEQKSGPVAYRGARIYTVAGAPIENGVLIIEKGKITAIGAAADPHSRRRSGDRCQRQGDHSRLGGHALPRRHLPQADGSRS